MEIYRSPTTPLDLKIDEPSPILVHWRICEGTRFPRLKAELSFIGIGKKRAGVLGRDEMRSSISNTNVVAGSSLLNRPSLEFETIAVYALDSILLAVCDSQERRGSVL